MAILHRLLGIAATLLIGLAAFLFASLVLAFAAAIALVLGAWLWWRGRQIARARPPADVIEGEYRVEVETRRLEAHPPER